MAMFAKEKPEPKLPQAMPMPPMVQPLRRAPEAQMSEFYARAMQEFQDVQSELKLLQNERDQIKVELATEQRENDRLRAEVEELQEKLDIYKKRVNEIEARFDDASAIILRVLDSRLTERPKPTPSIQRLEEEIVGPHEDAPHE